MRDSLIFYRSTVEAANTLSKENRLKFYDAIFDYALNDKEPKGLNGTLSVFFNLTKPLIDSNNKKYKNGCKGGRPKDEDSPRKEIEGVEYTNLTEKQYEKLVLRVGEEAAISAIKEFDFWLSKKGKTAKQYLGNNHYNHFRIDQWPLKDILKNKEAENQPNWSI